EESQAVVGCGKRVHTIHRGVAVRHFQAVNTAACGRDAHRTAGVGAHCQAANSGCYCRRRARARSTRRALGVSGVEDRPKVAVIPGYAECELIEVCFAEDHGVLSSKALHDSGIAVRNVLAEYL